MTSADPDATSKPMGDGSRPRTRKVLLFAIVAVVIYALDVVSKSIVVATLEHEPPVRLLGGAVYLVLTRNSGAAFSRRNRRDGRAHGCRRRSWWW